MTRLVFITAVAFWLAGCASPQQRYQAAMAAPEWEACYAAITGSSAAREAVAQRNINCTPYLPMIQARMQANQQQFNNGLLMLQAAQPRPQPMPQQPFPVVCRSVMVGNAVQTVCN